MKFYTSSNQECILSLTNVRSKDATPASRSHDRIMCKLAKTKAREEAKKIIEIGFNEYEFWGDLLYELNCATNKLEMVKT